MKKKLLEKIPMEAKKIQKNKKKWTVEARLIDVDDDKVLMISFYHDNKGRIVKDGKKLPVYRLFINKKEDLMMDCETLEWHSKKIENIPEMPYSNLENACNIDHTSVQAIDSFIPIKHSWESDPLLRVKSLQERYRYNKSKRSYELKIERIKEQMDMVDNIQIPNDFDEFVDSAFSDRRYIFYKADKNRRYVSLFCSHCKAEIKIDKQMNEKPKHNKTGVCTVCGSKIQYKASGKQKDIYDYKKLILMQKTDQGFVSRYFDITKISLQAGERYQHLESARVVYDKKKTQTFYNSNGKREIKDIHWWDRNGGAYSYRVIYGTGILYHNNINDVIDGTVFKYCGLKNLAVNKKEINHEDFLKAYESNRFIEYFIKLRLYNLTDDFVQHKYSTAINSKGKNPTEILKISKQNINRLASMNGNLYMLKLLQTEEKEGARFTNEQIDYLSQNEINLDVLNKIMEYTSATKALRYLNENSSYGTCNNMLNDWMDYIENCKLLKYDMQNEFILFPRHFKDAHDRSVKSALDIKNEHKDVEFKKRMIDIRNKYLFETKSFAIVIPNTTGEIIYEGQQLHHCVGTYVDRVIKGETVILFIREKETLDSPFYTMEVKNGKVVQVRGKNNCDMTTQVKQFVESFKRNRLLDESESEVIRIA